MFFFRRESFEEMKHKFHALEAAWLNKESCKEGRGAKGQN